MALGRKPARKSMDGFELVTELHVGCLGPLWVARNKDDRPALARRVPRGGEVDAAALDALQGAAAWAEGVQPAGVVRVLGGFRDEQELVVLSAFCEGESLRSLLRLAGITRRPIPAPVALRIAADVLDALDELHALRHDGDVVVGALHPDNVLTCIDGRTRLLEPGVSAVAANLRAWARDPKRVAYDAPEALDGKRAEHADLFSLGVLLWEMLRNRPLFGGASYDAVYKRVQAAAVRRVDSLKPAGGDAISASVADLVERALQRRAEDRFPSASAMCEAVEAEGLAEHDEVAACLQQLAGDMLARQRRKVEHAVQEARSQAPVVDTPTDSTRRTEPVAESEAPSEEEAVPEVQAAPVLPIIQIDEAPRPVAPPPPHAEQPVQGRRKLPPRGSSAKRTLLGIHKLPPPEAPVARISESEAPSELAPALVAAESSVPPAGPDSKDRAASLNANIESALAAVPTLPALPAVIAVPAVLTANAEPSDKGFDMMSIADDPSLDELPAPKAVARDEAPAERRPLALMVVGGALGLVALVTLVVLLRNTDAETRSGNAPPPKPTASASAAPSAAKTEPKDEPKEAPKEESPPEPPPSAVPSPPAKAPPPPWKAPPRPWPPAPHKTRPQPKYTPGGI